jgi:tRNA pseudouridine55 synthase
MYSALKRGGVPLYELARRGVEVERAPRTIEVFRLALEMAGPERLEIAVECSKGTYVRVLAAEIGRALGTVAHLERLRRTAVGAFRVEDAVCLDALVGGAPPPLVSVRRALAGLPAHRVSAGGLARLRHGQQDALAELPTPGGVGELALVVDAAGEVAAIVEAAGPQPLWRLVRLLAPPRS